MMKLNTSWKRTPRLMEWPKNPPYAGDIGGKDDSERSDLADYYKGNYYAVAPDKEYQWNAAGFQFLHQIFQMAVSELPKTAEPSITIAK